MRFCLATLLTIVFLKFIKYRVWNLILLVFFQLSWDLHKIYWSYSQVYHKTDNHQRCSCIASCVVMNDVGSAVELGKISKSLLIVIVLESISSSIVSVSVREHPKDCEKASLSSTFIKRSCTAVLKSHPLRYASTIGPTTALAAQAVNSFPWIAPACFWPKRSAIYAGRVLKIPPYIVIAKTLDRLCSSLFGERRHPHWRWQWRRRRCCCCCCSIIIRLR